MSGANDATSGPCAPRLAMRPSNAAKISGAATALASVPSTMAAEELANAARSGRIWRQQYARVSLVDAFGKRVDSPMGVSRRELRVDGTEGARVVRRGG